MYADFLKTNLELLDWEMSSNGVVKTVYDLLP